MVSRIACSAVAVAILLAPPSAQAYDERPMRLPATAPTSAATAAAASTEPSTWLVGTRRGAIAARIARRHGASALRLGTVYRLPIGRARAFAADLRRAGALTYAEPNAVLHRTSAFDVAPDVGPRAAVVDRGLVPPPAGVSIAVVDDQVDVTHPDLAANTRQLNPGPVQGPHGTAVASTAAGLLNGSGVFGIFPGAPVLSVGLPLRISCADASNGIVTAARAGARIINLSFGSSSDCATLFGAVQVAYAGGSLVVAAAGNEFAQGNPVIYPAAYPHVLSVVAVGPTGASSSFSSENTAVDVAAPGVAVPVAVPPAFDVDGAADGITLASGTSFSTPIVAGAAAWLAAVRPALRNGQLADVLRRSARDVDPPGYDTATGFGIVRMAAALAFPTPTPDVLEPNDGITFVDGSVFTRPDPYVWRGAGARELLGTIDRVEDPLDVYRIRIPRRAAIRIRLRPRFGDPDLFVYGGSARTTLDTSKVVARSTKAGRRVDSVRIQSKSRQARTMYVLATIPDGTRGPLDAAYRLEFSRVKRR